MVNTDRAMKDFSEMLDDLVKASPRDREMYKQNILQNIKEILDRGILAEDRLRYYSEGK